IASGSGSAPKGLRAHPDRIHIVYPLGSKLAVQNTKTKQQWFLEGHNNAITAVAISKTGKYVASGQVNQIGFRVPVIVWDFETREEYFRHETHKVRVESVMFSCCETYIMSLGGRDDSNIVAYNIHTKEVICGAFSSNRNAGDAVTLGILNNRPPCFITGGVSTLKVWTLCPKAKSVKGWDVAMGKIKRKVTCIEVEKNDKYAYCGTSTGDIVKVGLNFSEDPKEYQPIKTPRMIGCYAKLPLKKSPPGKPPTCDLYKMGVRQLILLDNNLMVVGAGDGTVEMIEELETVAVDHNGSSFVLAIPTYPLFKKIRTCSVGSLVTSLQMLKKQLIVGTLRCEVFLVDFKTFEVSLILTCHTSAIYDLAFPDDYSGVFATASKNDVRVWNVEHARELLRITVHNFTCSSIVFSYDGRYIATGWNDGNIRAFTPQSGKVIFMIRNAHNKGVSSLALTRDCKRLISGGGEGQVRVWEVRKERQELQMILKEHKGPVSAISIASNNREAASASTDGTCVIWDLNKGIRQTVIFQTTLFMSVQFHPTDCQVLTCGTNRQICYWEVYDGTLLRELEGSRVAALNTLHISKDGEHFVTGSNDTFVKLWSYNKGVMTHFGKGHAGVVTSVSFSPDKSILVSASADGSIFIWRTPFGKVGEEVLPGGEGAGSCHQPAVKKKLDKMRPVCKSSKEELISKISPAQSVHSISSGPCTPRHPGEENCF
ncbi:hypothetical protein AAG570_004384, partial [Ranatra chinensis]